MLSSTPSSLTVTWIRPDPLNGEFGLYEIRYAEEDIFTTSPTETPLFSEQFILRGVSVGVVYRLAVRASTRSLSGELLWGAFAMLRVRDGKAEKRLGRPMPMPARQTLVQMGHVIRLIRLRELHELI